LNALDSDLFHRAVANGNSPTVVAAADNGTIMSMILGDRTFAEEITSQIARFSSNWSGRPDMGKGWLRADAGDAAGIEQLDRGRRMQLEKLRGFQPVYAVLEADLLVRFSRFEEASRILAEAFALMEETQERWCEPEALRVQALAVYGAARASGAEAEGGAKAARDAESLLVRAMELAARQGARLWQLRAAVSLVRVRRGADPAVEQTEIEAPRYAWFDDDVDAADVREARGLLAC
jgi:hypothetical protein